jgi:hypothetical protein
MEQKPNQQSESLQEKATETINQLEKGKLEESPVIVKRNILDNLFSPRVKKLFYVCVGLFAISLLTVGAGVFNPLVSFGFVWMFGVGLSLLSVIVLFFRGLIRGFSGKSFTLVGEAIIFFVILLLVGFGTCLINWVGSVYVSLV